VAYQYAAQYGPASTDNTLNQLLAVTPFNVYLHGTTQLATLFTDWRKVGTVPQPASTDGLGNMTFFCDPGHYDVTCNGVTLEITLYPDPAEPLNTPFISPPNIDGGSAVSTYTASQDLDGGSASTVYSAQGIDGGSASG